ncbi:MAG TPA: hypothetical protein VGY54_27095 [Polyangiaceae bacterium]|nr:hypothetical protein [Polyangiaceae bacterium]
MTATRWLAALAMVLARESTNAVIPSNNHTTLRSRLTGRLATTISSLTTLRTCVAPAAILPHGLQGGH